MESRTEIAAALRMLSVEMTRITEAMQTTGALTEMAQHGIELAGAGQIALQWAEAIEAERGE